VGAHSEGMLLVSIKYAGWGESHFPLPDILQEAQFAAHGLQDPILLSKSGPLKPGFKQMLQRCLLKHAKHPGNSEQLRQTGG